MKVRLFTVFAFAISIILLARLTLGWTWLSVARAQLAVSLSFDPATEAPSPAPDAAPQVFKVLEIIYNPIIESQGGQKLTDLEGWNDPVALDTQYIADLLWASHDYVSYTVERLEVDDIPQRLDGFDYTDETYLACLQNTANCHFPDGVDYGKIFQNFDICTQVLTEGISEVWIWGGPYFGYKEYNVKGPALNIDPINIPQCGDITLFVMGFSYERGIAEMLENFGHRTEGILTFEIAGGNWQQNEANDWNKFSLVAAPVSTFEYGHCGNVHYGPNSLIDYDWANTRTVPSDCDDWYNYPNLNGTFVSLNCEAWGCNGYDHHKWWLHHLPHAPGVKDGHLNDWWRYVVDYDNAIVTTVYLPLIVN